jgi:hypothetical protein
LAATPKTAETNSGSKSFLSLILPLTKIEWKIKIQTIATMILKRMKANGLMYKGIASFAKVKVAP